MNKTEFIAAVAQEAGIPKSEAQKVVKAVLDVITEALKKGDKVVITGFGSFEVQQTKERAIFNPRTKETIRISGTKRPTFSSGGELKKAVAPKEPSRYAATGVVSPGPFSKGMGETSYSRRSDSSHSEPHEQLRKIRVWYHGLVWQEGKYPCYAFLLARESNEEVVRYFTEFGNEINQMSGKNCLVIALSDTHVMSSGFEEETWKRAVSIHLKDHSFALAEYFEVEKTQLPCLLFFKDIRHTEDYFALKLHNMTVEQIAERLASVFEVIDRAVEKKQDVLEALKLWVGMEAIVAVAYFIGRATAKTFGTGLEFVFKRVGIL